MKVMHTAVLAHQKNNRVSVEYLHYLQQLISMNDLHVALTLLWN